MKYKHNIELPGIKKLRMYDPTEIRDVVSSDPGLYIWWSRNPIVPVYIGTALNKRGLLGRVVQQHLCPTYLEMRPEKTALALCADYKGKKAAEKSVFRKKVSKKYSLVPGIKCVDFIMKNFLVSFISMADVSPEIIQETEQLLIETYRPEYNTLFAGIVKSKKTRIS